MERKVDFLIEDILECIAKIQRYIKIIESDFMGNCNKKPID